MVSQINFSIPIRGSVTEQRRSEATENLIITSYITLKADSEQVDVKVKFENRHENHYLRVMFPTGLKNVSRASSGGHFGVDCRSIITQGPCENAYWPTLKTLPFNNFLDVNDSKNGIAFISDSLNEYELLKDDERTVALSLVRSVNIKICTERALSEFPSQKGSQAFGSHEYNYSIRPHEGSWEQANIPKIADNFNVPLLMAQTSRHDGQLNKKMTSFFEIDNTTIRFSTIKILEDREGFVIRIYNPTDNTQKGNIKFHKKLKSVWEINLNEERQEEIKCHNPNIEIEIEPFKIKTLELQF